MSGNWAKGAAYGAAGGPVGAALGAGIGGLQDVFGSGRDGGANYAPQHGGFTGPGYGTPNSPGFDANGLATGQGQNGYGPDGKPLPPPPDPRNQAFNLGGDPNYAADQRNKLQGMGVAWSGIQGPSNPGINYGEANGYANLGNDARIGQADALGLMRDAAMGNAPSVAQLQQQRGMQDAMASQLSLAAGARGASGLAQAGYNAAGNVAALQRGGAMDNSMLRAGEQAQARGAYMGGVTGIRGQDLGFYGQSSNNAQEAGRQGLGYGQLGLGYRQLGLQGQLGMENLAQGVDNAQLNARMGYYGANDTAFANAQKINQESRANDIKTVGTVVDGVGQLGKWAGA